MKDYSELTSTGREANQELRLIELGYSEDVDKFLRMNQFKIGNTQKRISTAGDLIRVGKDQIDNGVYARFDSFRAVDVIQEIEEKLARIGLRLEGSSFTADQVRLSLLKLSKLTRDKLSKRTNIKTLGDAVVYGEKRFVRTFGSGSDVLKELEAELRLYGLKIEGSAVRIDEKKTFPKRAYISSDLKIQMPTKKDDLDKEKNDDESYPFKVGVKKEKQGEEAKKDAQPKVPRVKRRLNLAPTKDMTRQQFIRVDVDNLFLERRLLDKLHEAGIDTVGQLSECTHEFLKQYFSEANIKAIFAEINRNGIAMPYADYVFVNNMVVRKSTYDRINARKYGKVQPSAPKDDDEPNQ